MVKLQKRFAYKYKDKEHYKYLVTIPSETIEQLDWKPKTQLVVSIVNRRIALKPAENHRKLALRTVKGKRKTVVPSQEQVQH